MRALSGALVIVFPFVALVTNGFAASCDAQVVPGERGASANQMVRAHETYVREQVDATLERLHKAIDGRDPRKVSELYASDATLVTDVNFLQGRGAIHDRFERALPRIRNLRITVQDFEASGALAHVLGSVRYELMLSTGGSLEVESPISLVIKERRFGWLIQSQSGGALPATLTQQDKTPRRARIGDSTTVSVRLLDASGLGMARELVIFEIDAGDASLKPFAVQTDATGVATAGIRIGNTPGLVVVRATAGGAIAEPLFVSITVTDPTAAP